MDERHTNTEAAMDWDQIEHNWQEFRGKVQQQWDRLTEAQLDAIAGRREQLVGWIQEAYGVSQHAAEWQLSGWEKRQQPDWRPA